MATHRVFTSSTPRTDVIAYTIRREGERAVDVTDLKLAKTQFISGSALIAYDTQLKIIQDTIDTTGLEFMLTFNNHVLDSSGNDRVFTSNGSQIYVAGKAIGAKSIDFDGNDDYINLPENTSFKTQDKFSIACRFNSNDINSDTGQLRFICQKYDDANNWYIVCVHGSGFVLFKVVRNGVTYFIRQPNASIVANTWYDLVCNFDVSNVSTPISTILNGTTYTTSSALTTTPDTGTTDFIIGRRSATNGRFDGQVEYFRFYSNRNLRVNEASKLYNSGRLIDPLKFGGYIRTINDKVSPIEVNARSYGTVLGEIEINTRVYDNKYPHEIISDLIEKFTKLTFVNNFTGTSDIIERYIADGKLVDIIDDLSKMEGAIFRTDGWNRFIYENQDVATSTLSQADALVLTSGTNCRIENHGYDDTEFVNDLTIIGYNFPYRTIDTFSGNGVTTVFTVSHPITVPRVTIGGVEKSPDTDYIFDVDKRTLTFTVAPVSGTNNISVENEYERPIYIRAQNLPSINALGGKLRSKKLTLTWIRNYEDGIKFANAYLAAFGNVTNRYKVTIPRLSNYIRENTIVKAVSSALDVNGYFLVKSVSYTVPDNITEVSIGEFAFDILEVQKGIYSKIHNLESALNGTRDIRDYRTFYQSLGMVDTFAVNKYKKAAYNDGATSYNTNYIYTR